MVVEGGTCTLIFSVEVDNTIALKSKILRFFFILDLKKQTIKVLHVFKRHKIISSFQHFYLFIYYKALGIWFCFISNNGFLFCFGMGPQTIDHRYYELMNTLIFKYFGRTLRKVLGLVFNFGGEQVYTFCPKTFKYDQLVYVL